MEIMKTEAQAAEFANGLADAGDAMLFRDLWERRELDLIRGHFPDFMGGKEEAPASTVTANESTDETQAAASGNDAAAAE